MPLTEWLHASRSHAKDALGSQLENRAGQTVRDVIRDSGGLARTIKEAGHWADRTLAEVAEAAAKNDQSAIKALKLVKSAKRLRSKLRGQS